MKYPLYIRRIDDGELFVRNKDNTYSNKILLSQYPKHHHFKWSYSCLMKSYKGYFEHASFVSKKK